jgi:hypothetical protein
LELAARSFIKKNDSGLSIKKISQNEIIPSALRAGDRLGWGTTWLET